MSIPCRFEWPVNSASVPHQKIAFVIRQQLNKNFILNSHFIYFVHFWRKSRLKSYPLLLPSVWINHPMRSLGDALRIYVEWPNLTIDRSSFCGVLTNRVFYFVENNKIKFNNNIKALFVFFQFLNNQNHEHLKKWV